MLETPTQTDSTSSESSETSADLHDVVVIGGGPAGIGVGLALRCAEIDNFVIIERYVVGASFGLWPDETRFITPSFPTNSFGMIDLNSIAIGVSPAFSLQTEHPSGAEYCGHLREIAKHFELPVKEHTSVTRLTRANGEFGVHTANGVFRARHVIWAAGEFQYPRKPKFEGGELCKHTSSVDNYESLEGQDFIIIGGYESGVDAAYHLACFDKRSKLFDRGCPWESTSSDPSVALAPYSLERMRDQWFDEQVELHPNTKVTGVSKTPDGFEVVTEDGRRFQTPVPPLLANGFHGSHGALSKWFEMRDDGFPVLSENDESTTVPGLFLCGPSVRHDNHIFCFIYKFRQRFGIVANAICRGLGRDTAQAVEDLRQMDMYLDDIQYREALMKHISTLRTTTTPEGEECDDACVSRACPTC